MSRRLLAGVVGALAVLASVIAFGYASMAAEDFGNPDVSFWTAILGTGILWLLTLAAFGMGIHFLKYCVTGKFFQLNPVVRAFILGVLSFFPGLILSSPLAMVLAERRDDNLAMVVPVCFAAVLALIVCFVLVSKARRTDAASAGLT